MIWLKQRRKLLSRQGNKTSPFELGIGRDKLAGLVRGANRKEKGRIGFVAVCGKNVGSDYLDNFGGPRVIYC